jgi:alpha-L-fucosidase 2
MRLKNGGGHTGWSRVWLILFWARLLDGKKAGENLRALLQKSTNVNLFGSHPPFQIDSNLGVSAAVAEMLVQSHAENIVLLPALSPSWKTGSVKGLRLPRGITLDMDWQNGTLTKAVLVSEHTIDVTVMYVDHKMPITLEAGQSEIIEFLGYFRF